MLYNFLSKFREKKDLGNWTNYIGSIVRKRKFLEGRVWVPTVSHVTNSEAYLNQKYLQIMFCRFELLFFNWHNFFLYVLCSNYQTNKKSRHHWKVDFIYVVCPNQIESKVSCTFSTNTKNVFRKKSWYNTNFFV